MAIIDATFISGKRDRAMVIVPVAGGQPVTRHVRRDGAFWVGRNPNPEAVPANAAADARVEAATSALNRAEDRLHAAEAAKKRGEKDSMKNLLAAQEAVKAAKANAEAAAADQKRIHEELPLFVEYRLVRG